MGVPAFAEIEAAAIARHGEAAVAGARPDLGTPLSERTDDRLLAAMARRIFQAGFNWSVVDAKWPAIEEAFDGFDPARLAMAPDEQLDALAADPRVIRNVPKIRAIRDNAVLLFRLAREHGRATLHIGGWPASDQVGLFEYLRAEGSRLGGLTGPLALRSAGYDAFLLSGSVVAALNRFAVIDGAAASKRARRAVQDAFNAWHAETGKGYAHLSRILALSVPD
ncbi:MAG: 3-methyladenine DNA glycosylase [Alphaproteobacteria bacterium]|nr:MAG: 3-methyladenine DNA glycosylase [Alphaproteobacteria bacterium]